MWWSLWVGEALAQAPARVVVLQWRDTAADYQSSALHKQVQARIGTAATFAPERDLYQPGRTESDPALSPAEQRASPPSESLDAVRGLIEETGGTPLDAMSELEWKARAEELRQLAQDELWFVDRLELREPLFLLYAQIGRAAQHAHLDAPPFYDLVGGIRVNYPWYLAATLAQRDTSLLSKLLDQEVHRNVLDLTKRIQAGEFGVMTLSFDRDDEFDARAFAGEYKVYLNGFEEKITNPEGLLEVPLGIADLHLVRQDGSHGLSVRFERRTEDRSFEFALLDAQKRMGLDLIDRLVSTSPACTPELPPDLVNYLAVYSNLHPDADLHLAVPQQGSTSAKKLAVWRWDRSEARLELLPRKPGDTPCTGS